MRVWTTAGNRGCFRAAVATVLDLPAERTESLGLLPEDFSLEVESMERWNELLESNFRVSLVQLPVPPAWSTRTWIAGVRTGEFKGHALVARGLDVVHDPAAGPGEPGSWWGRCLPRSYGYELVSGFALEER